MKSHRNTPDNKTVENTQSGILEPAILRQIFDQSPNPIAIANENSDILECNAAMCILFGYTKEEMLNKKTYSFLAEETAAKLPELLKEENISKLIRSLPALKRPTISKLTGEGSEGWFAINTIIDKDDFLDLIPTLRKLAQGIVVNEPRQVLPMDMDDI